MYGIYENNFLRGVMVFRLLICAMLLSGINITALAATGDEHVVRVRSKTWQNSYTSCSAVAIGGNLILTAAHCIVNQGEYYVVDQNGIWHEAQLLSLGTRYSINSKIYSKDKDWAILHIKKEGEQFMHGAKIGIYDGGELFVVGWRLPENKPRNYWTLKRYKEKRWIERNAGKITECPEGWQQWLCSTAKFYPGFSGGALYNERGELVGINSNYHYEGDKIIHVSAPINKFMNEIKKARAAIK